MTPRFHVPWHTYAVLLVPGLGYAALLHEHDHSLALLVLRPLTVALALVMVTMLGGPAWALLSWALWHAFFLLLNRWTAHA